MTKVLADLCEAIVDCEHKTVPEGDGFALSVGTRAMKDGRLLIEACKPVSRSTYEAWARRMKPQPGDLVLAREAPVGQVIRVPEDPRLCLGQRTVLIRPAYKRVHPRFLHYWLLGSEAQGVMTAKARGATVPHLNVEDIRALDVRNLPDDGRVQEFGGETLGALDDLIENNRRRIELLEQMAQAIYREWFVRYRYPGHEDAAFVDSPLGPIPDGWEVRPLTELAMLDRTGVQPQRSPDERFDHFSIPAFDDGQLPTVDAGSTIKSGKFLLTEASVLVSKLNPRIERTWLFEPEGHRRCVASTEFLALIPQGGVSLEFLYLLARSAPFRERLRELSGGTSTSHQRAKPDDFLRLIVVVPQESAVSRFTRVIAPMLGMGRRLRVENRSLAALRDLLLPKLVTGEIDVSHLDLDAIVA